MKNLKGFLKGLVFTLFIVLLLTSLTLMIAAADTATRSIGFGDDTPAIGIEKYRDRVEFLFFGSTLTVKHQTVRTAADEAKKAAECFVPSTLRLFKEIIEKIMSSQK